MRTRNAAAAGLLLAALLGCEDASLSGGSPSEEKPGAAKEAASPVGSADEAEAERFELRIWSPNAEFKAGEPFEVAAELIYRSDEAVTIMHASPLAHFQIYDSNDQPLIKTFVTDQVGFIVPLRPNEPYNPGKQTLKVDRPGTYRIVATASFRLRDADEQWREELRIVSAPLEIVVK
ncbi:hypothetical protein [Paenibacillus sp.]|uniref:hypothetical protein n=1 Tax=Paenibacillus sp. TaxID=58172 RepID=UPI002D5E3BA3|nr:hypothetical protein [Paenibacillus sp.]HZG84085.1 hypothetical protein [Paenibacillus sp.]